MIDAPIAYGPFRSARLLLVSMLLVTLAPASGQAATLSGRIVNGTTPLPSLGVALYATEPSHPSQCASPDGGYAFDGLTRNTGVAIDPSGNVWLTNNWLNQPNPIGNPGGHSIVAFVGMAPPLRAPLIGTPQRP